MDFNFDLNKFFFGLIITFLVIFFITTGISVWLYLNKPAIIKSETPIKPEIELIIENNQVDTLYIYKKDKDK